MPSCSGRSRRSAGSGRRAPSGRIGIRVEEMSTPEDPLTKGHEFLQIVGKAKEFTEELLKENERLRFKLANLEAAGGRPGHDDRVRELQQRVRELEERLAEMEARYRKVEEENKEFADRYIEIEEQNNNLANLYVASYQLHSTLDYKEVVRIVQEIVINLIGAEAFHVLMVSEKTGAARAGGLRGPDARPPRSPSARGSSARPPRPARTTSPSRWPAPSPRPSTSRSRSSRSRSRTRDRRHLDQQAARPEDAVHHHGLRALHPARRPRRHRHLLRQALLHLDPEALARCRASWTC